MQQQIIVHKKPFNANKCSPDAIANSVLNMLKPDTFLRKEIVYTTTATENDSTTMYIIIFLFLVILILSGIGSYYYYYHLNKNPNDK